MKNLQLGAVFSSFDENQVKKAVDSIAKKIRAKAHYYDSKIPFSTTLRIPKQGREKKKKFNHAVVEKNGKKIIELFGTPLHASGRIYEENTRVREKHIILKTLAENNIYTFETLKHYHHEISYLMMLASFVMVFLAANLVFLTTGLSGKALGLVLSMFGVILMLIYSE